MSNKLIKCKICGQEIAKSAKKCPHCGAKNRKSFVLLGLLLVIVIAAAIFITNNMWHDYDITVTSSSGTFTIKASEVLEMVETTPQKYLDMFVNNDATVTFTAKVQRIEIPTGFEGLYACELPYRIHVAILNSGEFKEGDAVVVTGKFTTYRGTPSGIDYIRLDPTNIEVVD